MEHWTSNTGRAALQTLESMYLVETSKRLEVVRERFDFITQVIEPGLPPLLVELTTAERSANYANDVQQAISRYQQLYPDRQPSNEALSLLTSPGNSDTARLYASALLRILELTLRQGHDDLSQLKLPKAIGGRKTKLAEELRAIYVEFSGRCHGVPIAVKAKEIIEVALSSPMLAPATPNDSNP